MHIYMLYYASWTPDPGACMVQYQLEFRGAVLALLFYFNSQNSLLSTAGRGQDNYHSTSVEEPSLVPQIMNMLDFSVLIPKTRERLMTQSTTKEVLLLDIGLMVCSISGVNSDVGLLEETRKSYVLPGDHRYISISTKDIYFVLEGIVIQWHLMYSQ